MKKLENALKFFHACESAQGWDVCRNYVETDASFHTFAPGSAGTTTIKAYCDEVAATFKTTFLGSTYELLASAYDAENGVVLLNGISYAQHTGEGGPVSPTQNEAQIPFNYSIKFNSDDKITHLEKIFDEASVKQQLGWPAS